MAKVRFQNGADAPEIVLEQEIGEGASASEVKERLKELAHLYGTVEDAAAWLDGSKKPRHLRLDKEAVEAAIPSDSRLKENVVTAPPSPEAEAAEAAKAAKAEAKALAEHEQAVADNEAAQAEAEAAAEAEREAAEAATAAEAEAAAQAEAESAAAEAAAAAEAEASAAKKK